MTDETFLQVLHWQWISGQLRWLVPRKPMKCSSPGSSPCEKTTTRLLCQKSRKKWLSSSKLLAPPILKRLANGFCCGITGNVLYFFKSLEKFVVKFALGCNKTMFISLGTLFDMHSVWGKKQKVRARSCGRTFFGVWLNYEKWGTKGKGNWNTLKISTSVLDTF